MEYLPDEILNYLFLETLDFEDFDTWDEYDKYQRQVFDYYQQVGEVNREAGYTLGRIFNKPVADGRAHYMIVGTDGTTAHVWPLSVWDGYQDGTIADFDNRVSLVIAMKWVEQDEAIADMFRNTSEALGA